MTLIFDQKKINKVTAAFPNQKHAKNAKEIETKILKNYLNIVILLIVSKNINFTGYDILKNILQKQGIRLSATEIYRVLHLLENNKLIKSRQVAENKTVYSLTTEGKDLLADMLESKRIVELFMSRIFDPSFY